MTEMTTPRFGLPLLAAGQAQKELTHNEALLRLDLLAAGSVQTVGENVPPAAPIPGQCWLVGGAPEGAWVGNPHALAGWTPGGWRFVPPCEGMRLWVVQNGAFALFTGGVWRVGDSFGKVFVEGKQVVGPRRANIAEPTGGTTVDGAARAAIVAVLEALRAHGLIGPINL